MLVSENPEPPGLFVSRNKFEEVNGKLVHLCVSRSVAATPTVEL